jgi:hypothetical protein
MLLHVDAEIAHRQAAVREDWARSRRAPRPDRVPRRPSLIGLRRRAGRLLHAQVS